MKRNGPGQHGGKSALISILWVITVGSMADALQGEDPLSGGFPLSEQGVLLSATLSGKTGDIKLASTDCDIAIDFDDDSPPCEFESTTALRNQYSDLGIHFDGPGINDGGAILDDCVDFGVTGHSPPNFLAFSTTAELPGANDPQGPETVTFDYPIVFFEASFGSDASGIVTLTAYKNEIDIVDQISSSVGDGPGIIRLAVMGKNITKVVFNCTAAYWMVDDICAIHEGGEGVLVLRGLCGGGAASSNDFASPALARLGFTNVVVVNDADDFEFAIRTGKWDLVIMDDYVNILPVHTLDALNDYHEAGGRVIFSHRAIGIRAAHSFFDRAGVDYADTYTVPVPVYVWDGTPLFDTPNQVPDFSTFTNYCDIDGHRLGIVSATAAAGYTPAPTANQAAITIDETERIIINAFSIGSGNQDADGDTRKDMSELYENEIYFLAGLGGGALTADPGSLTFALPEGGRETRRVTLKNQTPAPVAWNVATARVLFLSAQIPGQFFDELRKAPGLAAVDYVDVRRETPTLEQLMAYDAVIVASEESFLDNVGMGDELADYVDEGGKVIHTPLTYYTWTSTELAGRFVEDGYMVFTMTTFLINSRHRLGEYDAEHPVMAGIETLEDTHVSSTSLSYGAVSIAEWDDGKPLAASRGDNVIGINIAVSPVEPYYSGDVARLFSNAIRWLCRESPLTINPVSGALAPGEEAAVEVTADAAGLPLNFIKEIPVSFGECDRGYRVVNTTLLVASTCPDAAAFSQRPEMPAEDTWGLHTSSNNASTRCFEYFSGLGRPITALRWWGCDAEYSGDWSECDRPAPDEFAVSFYEDDGGIPGALVQSYIVVPDITETGLEGRDLFEIKEYDAALPAPLDMDAGWLCIAGAGGGTCRFRWICSREGDGLGLMIDNADDVFHVGDLSLCIAIDPECAALEDIACDRSIPGNTAGQPDVMDVYPCAGWDASGPEAVYTFTPASNGTVALSLLDTTVDLDLYVLEGSCREDRCITFGDTTVSLTGTAGTEYFIVVDGYGGAEGSFILHANCPAGEGESEGEVEGESDPCASDTEAPVITLVGDPAMVLSLCPGDPPPLLPGALAEDACDGNLTDAIVLGGDTVLSAPGIYTVTYTVSDAAGNAAPQAKRMVTVELPVGENLYLPEYGASVECGTPYTPPQASLRNGCAAPTGTVDTTDIVNIHEPGAYILHYSHSGTEPTALNVAVVDTTPPVLTLTGDAAVTVDCGEDYKDLGATAADACEGDLTDAIEVVNKVNVDVPGEYLVAYSVSDSSGNAASTITRTVTVADNCGCCGGGSCQGCESTGGKIQEFQRFLGDYLLVGLGMIGLFLLSGVRR